MQPGDLSQVVKIDREAFPTEWPPTNFSRELNNRMAHYIVVCDGEAPAIAQPPINSSEKRPVKFADRVKSFFGLSGRKNIQANPARNETILGYAGMWIMADEAHITSIASRGQNRRQGIGEALISGIFELAVRHKARIVTLEVRLSNAVAQNLYVKWGFQKTGLRKGYYLDNREDAIIMSTDNLADSAFQETVRCLKQALDNKYGHVLSRL